MTTKDTGRCPFPHEVHQRKTGFGQDGQSPGVERQGDTWHLRSYAAVRQVLRDAEHVRQGIQDLNFPMASRLRPPVIFQDGVAHREQRTAIARFFTPKTVNESYKTLIRSVTGRMIEDLERSKKADLSALSMQLAVEVASLVVGLTDSRRPGLARRIDEQLSAADSGANPSWLRKTAWQLGSAVGMLRLYLIDVRPAIRARRKEPREDVISHLLAKGYNDLEILIECMTYATAGMTTTREFISVAAWHMLEDDALRRDYLAAATPERHRILHEILRLEPVASTLWRRAASDFRLEHDGVTHQIPAGSRLVLDIRTANADSAAVGENSESLCPDRNLAAGVQPPVLSFGDGAHRCPGAFLAIQESDIFLERLLRLPLKMTRTPHLSFNPLIKSYEVRDFVIEIEARA